MLQIWTSFRHYGSNRLGLWSVQALPIGLTNRDMIGLAETGAFQCLSLTFQCLSMPLIDLSHCLALPFLDFSWTFPRPFNGLSMPFLDLSMPFLDLSLGSGKTCAFVLPMLTYIMTHCPELTPVRAQPPGRCAAAAMLVDCSSALRLSAMGRNALCAEAAIVDHASNMD